MLPDMSFLRRKKLVKNAKIEKFKCDILSHFQTLCLLSNEMILILPFENW